MTLAFALTANDWWTIITAVLCCVACGTLGCFLVLRRMSMLGDAISHSILPGLAAAFMLTLSRDLVPMLLGAAAAGLATALLSAALTRIGRIPEDAALGVVFTTLFALGVVMLSMLPSDLHLDASCVLYGSIETVPLDTITVAGLTVPEPTLWLAVVAMVNIAVMAVFFKELKIVAFDPALATTMGIHSGLVHYGLLALVAATTVVSFEAVGSVLVVAMLIAPGATAHLLTDRLGRMLVVAGLVATAAATGGYLLALWLDTSVAGMISVASGGLYASAAIFSPSHGVLARFLRRAQLSLRICTEDILGMLYRWHERTESATTTSPSAPRPLHPAQLREAMHQPWLAAAALRTLARRGLVARSAGDALTLTPAGRAAAVGIVRSHRLWESYLAKHLGLPLDHLHEPSHRAEHFITPTMREGLSGEVGAGHDPHGRPIPAERATT